MGEVKKQRNPQIDIARGIAIISVVMGHTMQTVSIGSVILQLKYFVYVYQIALFAFASGMLYKDNVTDIWSFIARKLKSLYLPFVVYNLLYIAIRPIVLALGLINGGEAYPLSSILNQTSYVLLFVNSVNELVGPLWFVPMFFCSLMIFTLSRMVLRKILNERLREAVAICIYIAIAIFGLWLVKNEYEVVNNFQISILFVFFIAAGFYYTKWNLSRFLNAPGLILSFVFLAYGAQKSIMVVDLNFNQISNFKIYYPYTLIGIYFVLALAKYISKVGVLTKIFATLGQKTYDIMAMHLLVFKLVDLILTTARGDKVLRLANMVAYENLWWLYTICGVLVPVLVRIAFDWCRTKVTREQV